MQNILNRTQKSPLPIGNSNHLTPSKSVDIIMLTKLNKVNTRVNTFQDVRERARRARDWIAWKRDFEQTQQELEQILGFSLFTLLLWFVTHGVLLFTDEILYDKFFLKAFLKAINLFVNLKMDEMTLEKFRLWNTAALKVYLSVREKSIEGSFDELASR